MEINLDDLEAKCRAATPGPWMPDLCQVGKERLKGRIQNCVVNDAGVVAIVSESDPDAAFIAAANPAVTLELIAQLRAARDSKADILHLLSTALPFVEDHEGSTVYKAGAVAALVKDIKAAIAKAEA